MPKNALKKIISKIQIYLLFLFHYFIILCLETEYKLTINDYCTHLLLTKILFIDSSSGMLLQLCKILSLSFFLYSSSQRINECWKVQKINVDYLTLKSPKIQFYFWSSFKSEIVSNQTTATEIWGAAHPLGEGVQQQEGGGWYVGLHAYPTGHWNIL